MKPNRSVRFSNEHAALISTPKLATMMTIWTVARLKMNGCFQWKTKVKLIKTKYIRRQLYPKYSWCQFQQLQWNLWTIIQLWYQKFKLRKVLWLMPKWGKRKQWINNWKTTRQVISENLIKSSKTYQANQQAICNKLVVNRSQVYNIQGVYRNNLKRKTWSRTG